MNWKRYEMVTLHHWQLKPSSSSMNPNSKERIKQVMSFDRRCVCSRALTLTNEVEGNVAKSDETRAPGCWLTTWSATSSCRQEFWISLWGEYIKVWQRAHSNVSCLLCCLNEYFTCCRFFRCLFLWVLKGLLLHFSRKDVFSVELPSVCPECHSGTVTSPSVPAAEH